jgi:3-isopropylmalate/(R)-2-methylmalate dehydratase small subunit
VIKLEFNLVQFMEKFTKHKGLAAPYYVQNVDTDQIIPKQFLLRIGRAGFGEALFYDQRFLNDGTPNPDFILNQPKFKGASILLAGKNFGCGSSREHAPWALEDFGFRVVIASAFADIFYNNCFKIGMLPIILDEEIVAELVKKSETLEDYELSIDLENLTISDEYGFSTNIEVEEFRRHCLLNGLDDIGLTLQNEEKISEFEKVRNCWEVSVK